MIKIFIVTDEPEKWIEKFREVMVFDRRSKCSNEYYLSNNMFYIKIKTSINDSCRGYDPGIIIVDKPITIEQENCILKPLFGHGGSYKRTKNYSLIQDLEFDLKKPGDIVEDIDLKK